VAQRAEDDGGQASVELVAAIPALAFVTLLVAQLVLTGYALWSAGTAARVGARAAYVGGDPERAARSALPQPLRDGASVTRAEGVSVRVEVPGLIPGTPRVPLTARAGLGTGDADG
jgi:hypothetical protein